MRRLFAALAFTLLACRGEEAPTAAAPVAPPDRDAEERPNLLNIAYGAAVVSRTGEIELDHSAIRTIDGDSTTQGSRWVAPPSDPNQTIVYSLPALTRIEELGISTLPELYAAGSPLFETSTDGSRFERVSLPPFKAAVGLQLARLPAPVEARLIRMTIGEGAGRFATLLSVQARGRYAQPPAAPDIAGCWTVNGENATFANANGHIIGSIGEVVLEGGRDGAVYRFAWTRGGEWGHALLTLSPDGKNLSGIKWHQEPIAYDFGASWFGERCSTSSSRQPPRDTRGAPLDRFMSQAKRYPIYGSAAETIARVPGRIRLVSREFRGRTPEENRTRAKERLDALRNELQSRGVDIGRIEFVVAGSDKPHQPIENESMRVLYGAIEIER